MRHLFTVLHVFSIILSVLLQGTILCAQTRGIYVLPNLDGRSYLYKDYYALVVGVADYDHWPDLQNTIKDAREIEKTLKDMGMNVTTLLNPTSQQLKQAMNILTCEVGSEESRAIIFFFSGHGETETLENGDKLGYIVPKDCPMRSRDKSGFINKSISMRDIETYALRIHSKHVLMLFDSCFSGSVFASLKRGLPIPIDITEKSNLPVRQFITAGGENEQVSDDNVFRTCLIQGIKGDADFNADGYVTGSELGLYLQSRVVNYSKGCQHPQYGTIRDSHLDKGDFIFMSGQGKPQTTPNPSAHQRDHDMHPSETDDNRLPLPSPYSGIGLPTPIILR